NSTIYITVNTLEYLKKGGRITPAVALLGGMLKIKPILTIQGEKLDSFQKTRTMAKANKIMIDAVKKDINERIDPTNEDMSNTHIMIAYTYDKEQALELKKQVEEAFPNHEVICDPLSLSVACHIGPNALAIAACKKII
ncbi:MAG: DegV family protein, partial [Coprobacillus sp.]